MIIDDRQINEVQRKATAMIAATIATQQPVARDLRYLLTLDHVSYELERMGDHASSVAKQARKLAPHAPLKDYVELPRLGEQCADLVRGIIHALVDVDEAKAREVAALDDDVDDLYHSDLRRGAAADARGPGERRARDADPVRLALPRADRRPGHEHRRGHRVPRLGRGRGPEPVSDQSNDHDAPAGHDHDHGALGSASPDAPVRVLFVCWGNSARSIIAEALLRHLGGGRIDVYSAGIEPKGVNPLTVRVLEEAGLPTAGLASKSVNDYLGQRFDYVITVCDDTRGRVPGVPGRPRIAALGLSRPGQGRGHGGRAAGGVPLGVHADGPADPPVPADRGAIRCGAPARRAGIDPV